MHTVPRPDRERKSFFDASFSDGDGRFFSPSIEEMVQRLDSLESLELKAGTVDEKRNMRAARQNVARELHRLAPASRCTSRRPQAPRLVSRVGTGRAPGSPQRGAGGVPPPDDGDGDPPSEPPPNPDDGAVEALCRILGFLLPDDRANAACIIDRVRSDGPARKTGIMQIALSVWLAGINRIAIDCRDVFEVLAVDHIRASDYPEICIALGVEYLASGAAIASPQHADRVSPTTAVLS